MVRNRKPWKGNKICTVVEETYTNDDHTYIGNPDIAKLLTEKYRITKFYLVKGYSIATVGWSPKPKVSGQPWYGWSHRAISSFKTRKQAEKFAKEVA